MRTVCFVLIFAVGCKKPPPAPKGLDDSANYMMKHFYASDDLFGAGITGFLNWYEDEGEALVGESANLDTVNSYTVGDLARDSVAHLPIDDDILVDPKKDTFEARDITRAKGVVSLALMDCTWTRAEGYLSRPDQDVVFSEDFEGYERDYLSSRKEFEEGSKEADYDPIRQDLLPFDADFDGASYAKTLLMTENVVDPTAVLGANMERFDMNLDLRHGEFDMEGETVGVSAILTYNIEAAWGSAGANALLQSFSIELNVQRPKGKTLRMLTVWAEPKGGGIDPDSALALNFAVNKALSSSERLSSICAGDIEIPKE
jgi:hypothetical protein